MLSVYRSALGIKGRGPQFSTENLQGYSWTVVFQKPRGLTPTSLSVFGKMWIHSFKKHTILIDNHLSQFLISLFLSINISHGHLFNNVGFSVRFMKPNLLQRCKAWNQSPGNGKFCEK